MIEILDYFGDDLMVTNVARVSFGKRKEAFDGKDAKLITYLVEHKHTSPFRHPQIQFRIDCPIYVERQLFKHQIGLNANSISGRYVDFSDRYATIYQWRKQATNSKQGSDGVVDNQKECRFIEETIIGFAKQSYNRLLELGVSKEQARTILPLSLVTEFIWSGSLLAFIHLFNLRLKPDAQEETRYVVQAMLDALLSIPEQPFKHSLKAFGYSNE